MNTSTPGAIRPKSAPFPPQAKPARAACRADSAMQAIIRDFKLAQQL